MKKLIKTLLAAMLVVTSLFMLTACIPFTAETAKEKLEEKGYSVMMESEDEGDVLMAYKGDDMIMIAYCKSFDDVNEAYEDLESSKSYLGDGIEVKKKLLVVYAGTENAVEDFESLGLF